MAISRPLTFRPLYQTLVWGGRRLCAWRKDLPAGPVGESWEISDHARGESVVEAGPYRDRTLSDLVRDEGEALLGKAQRPGPFPLMVKLIDAKQRLSVQVHPDDDLARSMGVGENGKTECWVFLASGGEVFQGVRKGIDAPLFRRALDSMQLEATLNRFEAHEADVFFLPARTLHALGEDCLVYELQQTSDVTFRVYDWDRMGLDGKPRQLHVEESLHTIDFAPRSYGPIRPPWRKTEFGLGHRLAECAYFSLDELSVDGVFALPTEGSFVLITCLTGTCLLSGPKGEIALPAMRTALIPADVGSLRVEPLGPATVLVARPGPDLLR